MGFRGLLGALAYLWGSLGPPTGPAGVPLCHLPDPKHRQPQPRHGVPFDGQNLKLGKKLGFPHFWQLTPEVNGIPWGDGTLLGLMGSSGVNGIPLGLMGSTGVNGIPLGMREPTGVNGIPLGKMGSHWE